jgi:hypothetical protein
MAVNVLSYPKSDIRVPVLRTSTTRLAVMELLVHRASKDDLAKLSMKQLELPDESPPTRSLL